MKNNGNKSKTIGQVVKDKKDMINFIFNSKKSLKTLLKMKKVLG